MWEVDKQVPFRAIASLQQLVAVSIAPRQFVLVLMGVFGAVGLFLAAIGLFGIVNYLVAQRTQEIGLRIALGAEPRGIVRGLIGEGVRLAGIGVLLGMVGALALTRLLGGLLYGVSSADPLAFGAATLLVLIWKDPPSSKKKGCGNVDARSVRVHIPTARFFLVTRSADRSSEQRRWITLIFAGRDRMTVIRRELPRSRDASSRPESSIA